MNAKKSKDLKSQYIDYCKQCKKPESKTSWRRFKKLYNQYKADFLK